MVAEGWDTKSTKGTKTERFDAYSHTVIGCAIEVHRLLGPGMLESVYHQCLCHELELHGVPFASQVSLPVRYKVLTLQDAYRIDIVVDQALVVELKSVERLAVIHEAQILSYMRLSAIHHGLLINFNVPLLKQGLKRFKL